MSNAFPGGALFMINPDDLRAQASRIRELVHRPRKRGRPHSEAYLLNLALSFEEEARDLERRRAGDKPTLVLPPREEIDLGPFVGVSHD
jgi:hypothetical protein